VGLFFVLQRFIYWAGDSHDIATRDAGSVQEIPDEFIVLEAGHYIEDFTATRADVYWAKTSKVSTVNRR
jgi:hypothetical protein